MVLKFFVQTDHKGRFEYIELLTDGQSGSLWTSDGGPEDAILQARSVHNLLLALGHEVDSEDMEAWFSDY